MAVISFDFVVAREIVFIDAQVNRFAGYWASAGARSHPARRASVRR
jgi:hypothetical protein